MAKVNLDSIPRPILIIELESEDWIITPVMHIDGGKVMCRVESSADGGQTYIPAPPIALRVGADGCISERTCRTLCRRHAREPYAPIVP